MTAVAGLDELLRAVEAAGFALATPDDDVTTPSPQIATHKTISVEDVARGARDVKPRAIAPSAMPMAASVPGRTASAPTMRQTVYGYLGFGVPA